MSIAQTFTVTVVSTGGGNKYVIDGVQHDTVMIGAGLTYKFDQSDSSNGTHPLRFATAADAAGGTQYTVGVTAVGTPGSSGAYTQIEVANGAPSTLYYYCTNHGGMGGEANTDGWGRSYFGQADWGDTNIIETGWGRRTWGYQAWGDTPIVELTGLSATTSIGSLEVETKPGWGTLDWGENGWGTVESAVFNLTGLSATASVGTLIAKDVVGLTGLSATASVNSFASVSTNATITLSGLSLTSSAGLLSEDDHSVGLSGLSATSAVGSLAPFDIMGLSGLSATSSLGSLEITSDPVHDITGVSATTSLGTLTTSPNTLQTLAGQSATTAVGGLAITGNITVTPTGQVATISLNGDKLILKYYGKLDPKISSGYTIKTPKNTTGYVTKTPA